MRPRTSLPVTSRVRSLLRPGKSAMVSGSVKGRRLGKFLASGLSTGPMRIANSPECVLVESDGGVMASRSFWVAQRTGSLLTSGESSSVTTAMRLRAGRHGRVRRH